LLVLLIASLTATAAIPAYFSRSEVTLDNAARLLIDDLRQAQIRAVYRNAPVDVRFDASGDGYTVVDRQRELLLSANPGTMARRYSQDAVFEGVRLDVSQIGPSRTISFESDGTTILGGTITVGYRGDARTIAVEPQRGTIRAPEIEACSARGRP
jgi:Tfp pilus assembly protein FimT